MHFTSTLFPQEIDTTYLRNRKVQSSTIVPTTPVSFVCSSVRIIGATPLVRAKFESQRCNRSVARTKSRYPLLEASWDAYVHLHIYSNRINLPFTLTRHDTKRKFIFHLYIRIPKKGLHMNKKYGKGFFNNSFQSLRFLRVL